MESLQEIPNPLRGFISSAEEIVLRRRTDLFRRSRVSSGDSISDAPEMILLRRMDLLMRSWPHGAALRAASDEAEK